MTKPIGDYKVPLSIDMEELIKLLNLAATQTEQLKKTLDLIHDFKIETHLKA